MAHEFAITTATNSLILNSNRQGEAIFTVSNVSGREFTGRAQLEMMGNSQTQWFTLVGQSERVYAIAATEQYQVQVSAPPTATPGNYLFRLNMVGVRVPDDEFSEGPTITLQIPLTPEKKKPFPWWIVAVVAVVCLLGAVAVAGLFLSSRSVEVPAVQGLSEAEAIAALTAAGLQVERIREETNGAPAGQVIDSDPAGGSQVKKGDSVTLFVSTGPPPATATPDPSPTPPPIPAIFLIGHPQAVTTAKQILQAVGLLIQSQANPAPSDLVLVVISAPDGPMPQTKQGLLNLENQTFAQMAILMVNTAQLNDPELLQLVELESQEVLTQTLGDRVNSPVPVLYDNDPALLDRVGQVMGN